MKLLKKMEIVPIVLLLIFSLSISVRQHREIKELEYDVFKRDYQLDANEALIDSLILKVNHLKHELYMRGELIMILNDEVARHHGRGYASFYRPEKKY